MRSCLLGSFLFILLAGCGGSDRPINKDLDMPKSATNKEKDKTSPKTKE